MILRQYIGSATTNILAVVFLTIALLSFGYAEYFDRLFIIFLLGLILFNLTNANIVSIAFIFLFERSLEELVFFFSTYLYVKPLIYLLSLWLIRALWYDKLIKYVILPTIVTCIICELYWYTTLYSAPRIHSYIAMLMLNMITRHLIFLRVPIFKKFENLSFIKQMLSQSLKQVSVDLQLYSLARINILVIIIMIAEYLIRHLTGINSILMYEYYPYIVQSLTVAILFLLTNFLIKSTYKINA